MNNDFAQVLGTVAMVPKGEYDSETYYDYLNIVTYEGNSYVAKNSVNGVEPTDTEYWQLLTNGEYKTFNSVEDMQESDVLTSGMIVQTIGYYSANDGGGATYLITDDESDTEYQEEVGDLYATLIVDKKINIKQLGAYGDNTHDDASKISYAITHYDSIYIPSGTYILNSTITINHSINLYGDNKNSSIIKINSNADGILLNTSHVEIKDLKFTTINDYSHSIIKLLTPSNVVGQMIKDCTFIGGNNTGNGIEIFGNSNYGLMQGIIDKCVFNKLYNAIYFNLTEDSWNSACKISDCWLWSCVYGINYDNSSNGPSSLLIINFKGQYTNNVTQCLIKNLKGTSTTVDNCFIWDGGMTLDISTDALYTVVRNITVTDKFKFNDLGYKTRVENINQNTSHGRYYEYEDDFMNNSVDEYNIIKSTGASVTKQMVAPTAGEARPGILLQTGTTANDYASFNLGKMLLIDSAQYDLEFDLYCPDLSNVEFYCGGAITLSANPQGNFIGYNTSETDNTYLKAIDRGDQGFISSTKLINNPATNKWLHCQIKYLSQTRCLFFINEELLGEIDSHRYNQCPYFFIKTLDGTNKSLGIANMYLKTYIY